MLHTEEEQIALDHLVEVYGGAVKIRQGFNQSGDPIWECCVQPSKVWLVYATETKLDALECAVRASRTRRPSAKD
jgi:hypothetical protein